LVHHLLERIDREIDGVAAEEVLAVAADVEADVLGLLTERDLEAPLAPPRDLGILDLRHLEREAGRGDGLLEVVYHPLRDRLVGSRRAAASTAAGSEEYGRCENGESAQRCHKGNLLERRHLEWPA